MIDRTEIEDILRVKVEDAIKRHEEARLLFRIVAVEIPGGLTRPDGAQRAENTTHSFNVARDELLKAVKEFNGFLLDDVIPEDLHNTSRSSSD